MSADTLSPKSRDFFERSKMKQTLSMTFAGIGLLFLGMTCEDGGMSNASTILEDTTTGDAEDSLAALSSGYGFSCFFKLLASILSFGVSLYFSSFLCGTLNEKKSLRSCLEVEDGSNSHEEVSAYVEPPVMMSGSSPVDKSGAV